MSKLFALIVAALAALEGTWSPQTMIVSAPSKIDHRTELTDALRRRYFG
jgi:hypothetical protein